MSMINFLLKLVITVLFMASSMMIVKWRKLTKNKQEMRLYSRMSFGLFVIGIYMLLDSISSVITISLIINPINKIIELIGFLIIMFGFLDFLEVKRKK